jgi:hypothetical protein
MVLQSCVERLIIVSNVFVSCCAEMLRHERRKLMLIPSQRRDPGQNNQKDRNVGQNRESAKPRLCMTAS